MQEMQEMLVWSLGCEDPLEEEMATYSIILAWKIPWTEHDRETEHRKGKDNWQPPGY